MALYTLTVTDELILNETRHDMTGLGASIYLGFFAIAALWLFLTADGPLSRGTDDQGHSPDRSNSANTSAGAEGSRPWLVSHSLQK